MTADFVYRFIRQHQLAVISTVSPELKPEAALIGIAVSEKLELIFDTVKSSRKFQNILHNPAVALVVGWDNEITVQIEGTATLLTDTTADINLKEIYFNTFEGARERADTREGLVHFRIIPTWIRYSDFNEGGVIEEMNELF
jgi:general stress protein 26